ncbi:DUF4012 domain-containing protein [Jatrophihabitans sp. YIM 134969]
MPAPDDDAAPPPRPPSRLVRGAPSATSRPEGVPADAASARPWRRRPVVMVGGGVTLLLAVGLVWVVVTGLLARNQLTSARSEASALQTALARGDADQSDLDARIRSIAAHAHDAHRLTTGPAWAVTAALPWIGRPAEVTRGLTAAADQLAATSLPALGRVADRVASGGLRDGGRIDLSEITALTPDVTTAAQGLATARARIDGLPASTWLGPVDRAHDQVAGQIDGLAASLGSADTALQVLPTMLGAKTPQRYFVAFQNNAEARGTGGLPGAFGIVTAVDGTVAFERFESDDVFLKPDLVDVDGDVDFGDEQADYLAQYGNDLPFGDYRESNESPHFPYAARIWAAMWQKYSGEKVTGAVAVDPTALSYLLAATGPVELADGTSLSSADIVAVTQKDVYAKFPGLEPAAVAARKEFLLDVASRTEKALLGKGANTAELLRGASRAASERRLLVWSADPTVENVLAGTAIGGALPRTDQPFGLLTVLNVAGSKLDYYLDRRVSWTSTGCGDTRDVTVRITVTNRAPASGLPAYVIYRADDPPAGTPVGSNRWVLDWFATDGALLQSIRVDGRPGAAMVYQQRGHPVFRTLLETAPGDSHTVVLHLREPRGTQPVTLLAQPLIRPLVQSASGDSC